MYIHLFTELGDIYDHAPELSFSISKVFNKGDDKVFSKKDDKIMPSSYY